MEQESHNDAHEIHKLISIGDVKGVTERFRIWVHRHKFEIEQVLPANWKENEIWDHHEKALRVLVAQASLAERRIHTPLDPSKFPTMIGWYRARLDHSGFIRIEGQHQDWKERVAEDAYGRVVYGPSVRVDDDQIVICAPPSSDPAHDAEGRQHEDAVRQAMDCVIVGYTCRRGGRTTKSTAIDDRRQMILKLWREAGTPLGARRVAHLLGQGDSYETVKKDCQQLRKYIKEAFSSSYRELIDTL